MVLVSTGGRLNMTEAQIESKMVRMVHDRGGLCYKFVSPNNPGVPDRIVITPNGRTIYVELKTLIGKLSPIQRWVTDEMRKRGVDVRVLHDWPAVKEFIEEVMPA
jgi:hypothetical protein